MNKKNNHVMDIYKENNKLIVTIPLDEADGDVDCDKLEKEIQAYVQFLVRNMDSRHSYEMADKNQQFLICIEEYIECHYTNMNLSLQEIADYMQYSPRYMSQKFKKYSGMTINKYILNYRMKKAKELLINSNMSVVSVAKSVGIVNENYFYQLFKQHFGCTPKEIKGSFYEKH